MRASYSFISLGERCGAAWFYRYITKIPSATGVAAQRGKRLHTAAERYLKGEIPIEQLPVEFWRIKTWMEMVSKVNPLVEEVLYLDADWKVCPPEGAAWIFIIDISYDLGDVGFVYDLKSGKPYDSHAEQLQLYATAQLSADPTFKEVEVGAVYLDSGQTLYATRYSREQLPELQERWSAKRLAVIHGDRKPNPSFMACRFCSYAASRGGPCENEWKEQT